MIKAIIVDDEESCCDLLKLRLEKYKDEVIVLATAHNIKEAELIIKELNPDVVFLDIQMPQGSGFDLIELFPEPTFEIVFVTAYNEYAIKALKMSALDYLLKPVDPDELDDCLQRLIVRNQIASTNRLKVLNSNLGVGIEGFHKLVVPLVNGFEVVNVADIIYCQAESNYTKFFVKNDSEYLVCKSLKEFEEILIKNKTPFMKIGKIYGKKLKIIQSGETLIDIPIESLRNKWKNAIWEHMG